MTVGAGCNVSIRMNVAAFGIGMTAEKIAIRCLGQVAGGLARPYDEF